MFKRLVPLFLVLLVLSACGDDSGRATADAQEVYPSPIESSDDPSPSEPEPPAVEPVASDAEETPVEEAPAPSVPVPEDRPSIRGMRYCEILLFLEGDDGPTAEVWGTQGVNFCPAEVWEAIDPEAVRAEYGAVRLKMNGPRYFVVDLASGAQLPEADRRAYGDLDMQQLATLQLDRLPGFSADGFQLSSAGYVPITVLRTNTWHFYAGSEIYELTDPDGVQYVMQAYSQIVDPDLSEEDLASLGQRLELPEGWSFEARILEEDLDLAADGEAVVIQDELENTYQRR